MKDFTRRQFIKQSGLLFVSSLLPLGLSGWAARLASADSSSGDGQKKRLIVVFQRGAVDGLNVVVPYGDSAYYNARPTIAIRPPGPNGALNLDGFFGLHPALASVLSLWNQKSLAFVHAAGAPEVTRSHFDAQKMMECGTPGVLATPEGWMNRLLSVLPGESSPTRGLAVGAVMPFILRGKSSASSINLRGNVERVMSMSRPAFDNAFDSLYDGIDPLSIAYKEGRVARTTLAADLEREMVAADNGAPPAAGFPESAAKLGAMMAGDPNIQLAFIDIGGWDTHIKQGADAGQLANHLLPFGDGLDRLIRNLGPAYAHTAIVVISEFGRTAFENGNAGTDHGHGTALWVMGAGVRGGKVYGEWPGLTNENLFEGRDLAVTTDYRDVISPVLVRQFNLNSDQLKIVFPSMTTPRPLKTLF